MTADRVKQALDAGWTSVLDGFGAVAWFTFDHRGRIHKQLDVLVGDRRIEVAVSPTGRSVRVFVDGQEVKP